MNPTEQELEQAWLDSRTPAAGEALVAAINTSGGRAALAGGSVFVRVPLPDALQRARADYKAVTDPIVGQGQKVLIDLLLFRVVPTEPYLTLRLPDDALEQLDEAVMTASPEHEPVGGELAEWVPWCFTELRTGSPLRRGVFDLDMATARNALEANDVAPEKIEDFEARVSQCAPILEEGIASFHVRGYFAADEPLAVHWQNDDDHPHGLIRTPWVLSVGRTHALAEIRRGTWY